MYKIDFSNFIDKLEVKKVVVCIVVYVLFCIKFAFGLFDKQYLLIYVLILVVFLCSILISVSNIVRQLKGIKEMKKTIKRTTFLIKNLPYTIEIDKKYNTRIKVNYNNNEYYSYPIYCKLASKNGLADLLINPNNPSEGFVNFDIKENDEIIHEKSDIK